MLDDFTKAELARIDYLYGTDFKDIKPEDALLIGRYEAEKAKQETEFKKHLQTMQDEANAKIAACKAKKETALANLNELHNAAIARLEKLENGK